MTDRKSKIGSSSRPTTPTTPTTGSTGGKPKWPTDGSGTPGTPTSMGSGKPRWPGSTELPTDSIPPKQPWWRKMTSCLGHLGIIVFLALYTAAGGVAFKHLEQPYEQNLDVKEREMYNEVRNQVTERLVMLGEDYIRSEDMRPIVEQQLLAFQNAVIEAAENGVDLNSTEFESKWEFASSFFFAATVVTTIGYGNIAPLTTGGQIFTIIYALFGIPLTLIAIGDMGKLFASLIKSIGKLFRKYIYSPKKKDEEDEAPTAAAGLAQTTLRVVGAITLLIIYIALGAAMFCSWEDWSFFKAFYFCFITMTTIGLGDVVPDHQMYMMACTTYILIGLAVTSMCIELARAEYEKSWQKMLDASRKLHGISLADTLRKLNDQIETHGEIVDFSIMKDIRNAIKGMGTENGTAGHHTDHDGPVVYESNV